jgi:L-seryl-tRNA(Ser) seleniumtransferase
MRREHIWPSNCACGEAALGTSGAAAAFGSWHQQACVTLGNEYTYSQHPHRHGRLKNEVIVQKTHRYGYESRPPQLRHTLRRSGEHWSNTNRHVQRSNRDGNTFSMRVLEKSAGEIGSVWLINMGVPCFNDAARDVPPISNLWNYTQMGFDLVTFRGKGLRGPQCTDCCWGERI